MLIKIQKGVLKDLIKVVIARMGKQMENFKHTKEI